MAIIIIRISAPQNFPEWCLCTGTTLAPAASAKSKRREAHSTPFNDTRRYIRVAGDWLAGWHVPLLALYDLDSSPVTTETVN